MKEPRNELGQFVKGQTISPEKQEKMIAGKQAKKVLQGAERKRNLLLQLGFVEPFQVDIETLADMFLSGKTNAVSSHSKLLQRSPLFKDTDLGWTAEDGTPCPTCGHKPGSSEMSLEDAREWLAVTEKGMENLTGQSITERAMNQNPIHDKYADDPVIVEEPIDDL